MVFGIFLMLIQHSTYIKFDIGRVILWVPFHWYGIYAEHICILCLIFENLMSHKLRTFCMFLYDEKSVIIRVHFIMMVPLVSNEWSCPFDAFFQKLSSFQNFLFGDHKWNSFQFFFNHKIVEVQSWANLMTRIGQWIISCCSLASSSHWGKVSIGKKMCEISQFGMVWYGLVWFGMV